MAASKTKSNVSRSLTEGVDLMPGLYSVGLALVAYLAWSVALDRGSLWVYALMFTALYWALHYGKAFVKQYLKR